MVPVVLVDKVVDHQRLIYFMISDEAFFYFLYEDMTKTHSKRDITALMV